LTEIEVGRWGLDPLNGSTDDLGARGVSEPFQLLEMLFDMNRVVRTLTRRSDKKSTFDGRLNLNQASNGRFPCPVSRFPSLQQFPQRNIAFAA
jgi:hypothetical protein